MPIYRATVWFLHCLAESDAEMTRHIYELETKNEWQFKAQITDQLVTFHNVDNEIWFGPVSEIDDDRE